VGLDERLRVTRTRRSQQENSAGGSVKRKTVVRIPEMCCHRLVPEIPTDLRTMVAQPSRAVAETTAAPAKNGLFQPLTFSMDAGSFDFACVAGG
jgi:hypothetical protein